MNFDEYYKYYLSLHKNIWCRRFHVMGQLTTFLYAFFCIMHSLWLPLVLTPLIIFPFAWFGHIVFEKNTPLSWEGKKDYGLTAIRAKACDLIMLKDWIIGRIER